MKTFVFCCLTISIIFGAALDNHLKETACTFQCFKENSCFPVKCNCTLSDVNFTMKNDNFPVNLICVQDDVAHIGWEERNSVYFLEVFNDLVVYTRPTFCNYFILEDLTPNTTYNVRVYSLTRDFKLTISKELNFTTKVTNNLPEPVEKMWLQELTPIEHHYHAEIQWEASDNSCYYDIVWYCKNSKDVDDEIIPSPEHAELRDPMEAFNVTLTDLVFGCDYSVTLTTRSSSWTQESSNKTIEFSVPSCLETFNSLSECAPPRVENVTVWEEFNNNDNFPNVHVNWTKPILIPDYYKIYVNVFNTSHNRIYNVSGNETSFEIEKVKSGSHYQLYLQAFSTGGKSSPVIINRKLENINIFQNKIDNIFYVIIIGLFMIIIIILILFMLPIKRKESILRTIRIKNLYTQNEPGKVEGKDFKVEFTKKIDEWEISQDKLTYCVTLGEGAFGVVYQGLLEKDGIQIPVAVKTLKENPSMEEIREMEKEIYIMKNVGSHPNIVSILGCISHNYINGSVLIVEYCPKGSLLNYLRNIYTKLSEKINASLNTSNLLYDIFNQIYEIEGNEEFTYKDFLSFARQIALGMEYLSSQKVLHRDLAARNILICDNGIVKVSDFGLSRDVYMDSVYFKTTNGRLPVRWMALESLTHQIYTTQSDVWSYGILLWEMTSLGALPYPDIETCELLAFLKEGGRMSKLENCNEQIYNVMASCWNEIPADRPSFSALVKFFDALLNNCSGYVNIDNVN